jgi:hypothetical protein
MDKVQASEDLLRLLVGEASLMSRRDRKKLVKLLAMLGSDHAGERDNAARAIERLRRERGLSWAKIFGVG